jgi:hypothetical protein
MGNLDPVPQELDLSAVRAGCRGRRGAVTIVAGGLGGERSPAVAHAPLAGLEVALHLRWHCPLAGNVTLATRPGSEYGVMVASAPRLDHCAQLRG